MHYQVGCYPELRGQKHINGAILKVPKNVFTKQNEEEYIYEIEDSVLNIYNKGKKLESIDCPTFGLRCLIAFDIIGRCDNHGYSSTLLKVINNELKEIDFDFEENVLHKISSVFQSKEDFKQLENNLLELLESFTNGKPIEIKDSLRPVFSIISSHFVDILNKQG